MAVAVCGVSPLAFPIEQQEQQHQHPEQHEQQQQQQRFDIWNAIQAQKPPNTTHPLPPYIHPLVRRSSSSLSQKSLEVCTESLGSETGSDVFSDDEFPRTFSSFSEEDEVKEEEEEEEEEEEITDDEEEDIEEEEEKELLSVNYHCCIRTRSPARSFPPPLPSISRRDGPCLSMRPHRRDGRLVVEAVHVPSQNYLQAERHNGRLLLSFINTTSPPQPKPQSIPPKQAYIEEMPLEEEEEEDTEEEEEEEEEVEVVDRGTVVEVKVSMQPQQQSGVMKVHRSTLVINKFVGGTPLTVEDEQEEPRPQLRRVPSTTMTAAAAAVVAASSLSGETSSMDSATADSKLLFTSKGRSKGEVLHRMRRCSELRRPIFFWEPCCIATSSS